MRNVRVLDFTRPGYPVARLGGYAARTLSAKRRAQPRNDIVSVLASSTIDGDPMPVMELLSYFMLLVVALVTYGERKIWAAMVSDAREKTGRSCARFPN